MQLAALDLFSWPGVLWSPSDGRHPNLLHSSPDKFTHSDVLNIFNLLLHLMQIWSYNVCDCMFHSFSNWEGYLWLILRSDIQKWMQFTTFALPQLQATCPKPHRYTAMEVVHVKSMAGSPFISKEIHASSRPLRPDTFSHFTQSLRLGSMARFARIALTSASLCSGLAICKARLAT